MKVGEIMGCSWASGLSCPVTGDRCMFLIPNSKACAEKYGEGPEAERDVCEDCKHFYMDANNRCCDRKGHTYIDESKSPWEIIESPLISKGVTCCGAFAKA